MSYRGGVLEKLVQFKLCLKIFQDFNLRVCANSSTNSNHIHGSGLDSKKYPAYHHRTQSVCMPYVFKRVIFTHLKFILSHIIVVQA